MDVTIILPLLERIEYTERWVQYAEHVGLKNPVIVLDGSKEIDFHKSLFDESNLNSHYYWTGHDCSVDKYIKKMCFGLSLVSTKYCVLVDNDDFIIPDFYEKAEIFLNDNIDHVCCGGELFGLYLNKKKFTIHARPLVSIEDNDGLRRLDSFFSTMQLVYYDVVRVEHLRNAFEAVQSGHIYNLFLVEYYLAFYLLLNGRAKKIKYPFLVRQHDSSGSGARSERTTREMSALEICSSSQFSNHYKKFITSCIEEGNKLYAQKRISHEMAVNWLDAIHFEIYISSILKNEENIFIRMLLKVIKVYGPTDRMARYRYFVRLIRIKFFQIFGVYNYSDNKYLRLINDFLDATTVK